MDQGEIEGTVVLVKHVIHDLQQMMAAAAVALINRTGEDADSYAVR